jgi:crotonobetainyl-CoA:carnitine CoA-transferase CaiB-like acyl-CoA transferase
VQPCSGVRVLELAQGVAGAYAGKLLADLGADVFKATESRREPLWRYLNAGKRSVPIAGCVDIVIEDTNSDVEAVRNAHPTAVVVSVTPFGAYGARSTWKGNDLIAFHSSGFAYAFPAPQVDSRDLPPLNAPTYAAELLAGQVVAVAALHGLLVAQQTNQRCHLDVSEQEAVAAANHSQFNRVSQTAPGTSKRVFSDRPSNSVVALLPCSDGWVAISPREEHQWARWLEVMGNPDWSSDPRFTDRQSRDRHWPELYELLAHWSRTHTKMEVFAAAQARRVACFPLGTAADLLDSPQLGARDFFVDVDGLRMPGRPYQLTVGPEPAEAPARAVAAGLDATLPLRGVRVIDFSWVLTGPICTRYLAALGAEVIKIESSARADLSHRDHSWEELNPGKRSITLNLKDARARDLARRLIALSDVVVENFSSGVMERLELDYSSLVKLKPDLIMASSSALGRTGPQRDLVAYGTLIQCFTGWASLSAYPDRPPQSSAGVWTDPLTAMLETLLILAALWRKRESGIGGYFDLSMAETTIAALPEPILAWCASGEVLQPRGNRHPVFAPQGCYPARGDDYWVALSVQSDEQWTRLCDLLHRRDLRALSSHDRRRQHDDIDHIIGAWTARRSAEAVASVLQRNGIAACPTVRPDELICDAHLRERNFITDIERLDGQGTFSALGVPWLVDRRRPRRANRPPGLGEDNEYVFRDVLGLAGDEYALLRREQVIY